MRFVRPLDVPVDEIAGVSGVERRADLTDQAGGVGRREPLVAA